MTIVFFEAAYYACWAWHGGNISFKFERVVGKTTGYICCKTLVWVSAQSGSLKTLVTFLSLTYKEINISGYPCICLSILWILTCIGFPGIVAFDCVSFCEMSVFGSVWVVFFNLRQKYEVTWHKREMKKEIKPLLANCYLEAKNQDELQPCLSTVVFLHCMMMFDCCNVSCHYLLKCLKHQKRIICACIYV